MMVRYIGENDPLGREGFGPLRGQTNRSWVTSHCCIRMPHIVVPRRLSKALQHLNRVPEVVRCRRHTKQWLTLTSAYLGLGAALPFEVTLSSGNFHFREISDVATFWQIFYRGIYPVERSDRLIVDAGANIGAFALYALQAAPEARIIAVEPAADSCGRIRSMLRAHHLESRCILHEAALAASIGHTTIDLNVGSQFRRSGTGSKRVAATTLDSIIPRGEMVDLLKMDIEGAEYEVLRSTSAQMMGRIRRIVLEFHPEAPYQSATDPLIENGFELVRYRDDGGGYGMVWLRRSHGHLSAGGKSVREGYSIPGKAAGMSG